MRAVVSEPSVADETVGFHLQQALEKLMKAALDARDVTYRRTHDLVYLADLLVDAGCAPPEIDSLADLNSFGVVLRYDLAEVPPLNRSGVLERLERWRTWATAIVAHASAPIEG